MTIRTLSVDRRVVGTIDQQPSFTCHYTTRPDENSQALAADFMIAAAVAYAGGSPSAPTFLAVSEAVRAYGRALAGTDGTHDEYTHFSGTGPNYDVIFRDVPPVGAPTNPVWYTLQDVKDVPGAPPGSSFDAVIAAIIAYGDSIAS